MLFSPCPYMTYLERSEKHARERRRSIPREKDARFQKMGKESGRIGSFEKARRKETRSSSLAFGIYSALNRTT
jgi:hypothetical protein